MAISILTIDKPHIRLQAITGGSLSPATYYFIGWNAFSPSACNSSYYGNVPSPAGEEVSVTTDATYNRIKMEIYYKGGDIISYADAGSGHITVTTTAHGLSNGNSVWLRGTTNYTGVYTILNVTTNSFDITATWVGDDGTSKWFSAPGMNVANFPTNSHPSFYFKWDYFSMKRADGSYFQWNNTNNPAINDEWLPTEASPNINWRNYGHHRWSGAYYTHGMKEVYLTIASDGSKYKYYDAVVLTTGGGYTQDGKLYERASGGMIICADQNQPQIALRKYYNSTDASLDKKYFSPPIWMDINISAVLIWIDSTNAYNTWSYLVSALIGRNDILGKSIAINYNSTQNPTVNLDGYTNRSFQELTLRGSIVQDIPATGTSWSDSNIPTFVDKNITVFQGKVDGTNNTPTNYLRLKGCNIDCVRLQSSYWVTANLSLTNSRMNVAGNTFVVDLTLGDNLSNGSDCMPMSYSSKNGLNIVGSKAIKTNLSNICRYIPASGMYIRNTKFINATLEPTFSNITTPTTFELTNIEFSQVPNNAIFEPTYNGPVTDIMMETNYTKTTNLNFTANCYHVTSKERPNGLVRVGFRYPANAPMTAGSIAIFKFHETFNLKVVNVDGVGIENANVKISNSKATPDVYNVQTNSNGNIPETNVLIYTVEKDLTNPDGYAWNTTITSDSKTTVFNNITIEISATNYESIVIPIYGVLDKITETISLKLAKKIMINLDD